MCHVLVGADDDHAAAVAVDAAQVEDVVGARGGAEGLLVVEEAERALPGQQDRRQVVDGEGRLISVMILDVAEGQIQGVSAIANPDKLRHLGPVADLRALLRERS